MKLQDAEVYTDFSGLAKLKTAARKHDPAALQKVAAQFESIFLSMVLKSMRQAKLADGIMDSDQSKFFQDMYDQQLAVHLSAKPGIGLADLIVKQLSPKAQEQNATLGVEDYLRRPLQARGQSNAVHTENKTEQSKSITSTGNPPINNRQQFVEHLRPFAEQAANELGVDAGVLLAQAALETGWGKGVLTHADGRSSFNLFNIKADKYWKGESVEKVTLEFERGIPHKQKAKFRSYGSWRQSFMDYARFIKNNPRYQQALKVSSNPEQYMHELQKAGYATDPEYARKVMRVYKGATRLAMN
ncbi:flagellar assembly peptidoglycan hydrolase FlgJ [methane-oxidizing endosymbiont of Gigantopelta aegis]|uniref:flagellar assembly peptidoglycan hydrolase FlgJ n=1 Tax=methane-oxidizing endosymbiont of Gigantopelta aegis TaxID=2794938 RepID=UPI0018DD68B3|nr:flagellar assembly peptidoglycan hydrolase FlgJ [methane-oxidizing endosymbiont of Gigantopelta aegis]